MATRNRTRRDEQGSITLFFITMGLALFLVVGLVVDGGGKIRALQRANTVADQAARAGGQAINGPQAIKGDGASIDVAAARAAAQAYLNRAGVGGSVAVVDGTHLRVSTITHYNPVFLGLMGMGDMTTHGDSEVRLVSGIDGGTP